MVTRHSSAHSYSSEEVENIIEYVCGQIAAGRALSRVLSEDKGMPTGDTFWKWVQKQSTLADRVTQAREAGVEALLSEVIEIADTANGDAYIDHDKAGKPIARIDGEAIQRSKLRVESRFKYAQMIAPRKYGDKLDVTSGGEPLPPPSPLVIDARVQTIMLAAQRRRDGEGLLED